VKYLLHTNQAVFASLGGVITWFLGGIDNYIYVLAIFVSVDYVTGIIRSVIERNLSSIIGGRVIVKKVLIFILVGLSNVVDEYLLMDFGVFRIAIVFFYISNEGISILENAHAIGLPIPAKLKNILWQLRDKPGGKEGSNNTK